MRSLTLLFAALLLTPRAAVAQTDGRGADVPFAVLAAQGDLAEQLRVAHHGRPAALPPFYRAVLASVERRLGLAWRGPAPRAIPAPAKSSAP